MASTLSGVAVNVQSRWDCRVANSAILADQEITAAQRVLLSGDPVDLPTMVLLNVHQHYLASRDAMIPHTLPMAWAAMDEVDRARSLARSMTEEAGRDVALVGPGHPRYEQPTDIQMIRTS